MAVLCGDCSKPIYDAVLQVIAGKKEGRLIKEQIGVDICNEHRKTLEGTVHPFRDMPEGDIVMVLEAEGEFAETDGALELAHPSSRTQILGYLSLKETKGYLPGAYVLLNSGLKS